MMNSQDSFRRTHRQSETPGPLGWQDSASPDSKRIPPFTPGTIGVNDDHAPVGKRIVRAKTIRTPVSHEFYNFPDWVPHNIRDDIQRRYGRGEFTSGEFLSFPQGPSLDRRYGKLFRYSDQHWKPFGIHLVWVGLDEFLGSQGGYRIQVQFWRELPEDTNWWENHLKENKSKHITRKPDTYSNWARKYNKRVKGYLIKPAYEDPLEPNKHYSATFSIRWAISETLKDAAFDIQLIFGQLVGL
jgi:hypothetical protein